MPRFLAVRVNGVEQPDISRVLQLPDGGLAVPAADLRAWHLRPPGEGFDAQGRPHHRLDAIAGAGYRVDPRSQTLELEVPPAAFVASTLTAPAGHGPTITPSPPGAFFNYDLRWQRSLGLATGSGLFELGAFNRFGSGTATGLWTDSGLRNGWVRLDTAWVIDDPQRMRSLRLGDAIGRSGTWGRSVRFGGLQWGSNFAVRPDFITFPLPGVRGEAALPSTLDVYVNNVRRMREELPPGSFDIPEVPIVTGQGEIQLVVTDLMGRRQVISQPYYASPRLLRPGLADFSVEAGMVRVDYGLESTRYGRGMLAATHRLGVTPEFTRELRAEILGSQQTLGAAGAWLWPGLGIAHGAVALSRGPEGSGRLLQLGAERQTRGLSLNLQAAWADRDFVQLGSLPGAGMRRSLAASVGLPLGGSGLALTYVGQTNWQGDEARLVSASYGWSLDGFGFLAFYALRDLSGNGGTSIGLSLVHNLDMRTSATASAQRSDGRWQNGLQLQRNLPAGDGLGYRVLAERGRFDRQEAGAILRTAHGDLSGEVGRFAGTDYYRAGISGGVASVGGHVFAGRRVEESFAVVEVDGLPGVRIYRDNQEVGRTGADGSFLVTRLLPYHDTPVAVEQADLPIDAEVEALQLRITPGYRSGVLGRIPVRRSRGASFRAVDEQGRPLPLGATVRLEGADKAHPVGYDGRAYVSGPRLHGRAIAELPGRRCALELPPDAEAAPMPELGTLTCREIAP